MDCRASVPRDPAGSSKIPPALALPGQAWGLSLAARLARREQGTALLALVGAAAEMPQGGGGRRVGAEQLVQAGGSFPGHLFQASWTAAARAK